MRTPYVFRYPVHRVTGVVPPVKNLAEGFGNVQRFRFQVVLNQPAHPDDERLPYKIRKMLRSNAMTRMRARTGMPNANTSKKSFVRPVGQKLRTP